MGERVGGWVSESQLKLWPLPLPNLLHASQRKTLLDGMHASKLCVWIRIVPADVRSGP